MKFCFLFNICLIFFIAIHVNALEDKSHTDTNSIANGPEKINPPIGTLPPFGENLFYNNFPKEQNDGISPNYQVTYGDRISVHSWGALEVNNIFTVDSQGNIFLPEVGPIHISGVRNKDLTNVIYKEVNKVYKDHFKIYTSLLSAKPINVYVTGFVQKPGRYPGFSVDSILYYLNKAGGILPELGTYRDIAVQRNGETIQRFDLYDFILKGKIDNFQFLDNDVVLVTRRGSTIKILGDVLQKVILEFLNTPITGQDILDIIAEMPQAHEVVVTGTRNGGLRSFDHAIKTFALQTLKSGDTVIIKKEKKPTDIIIYVEGSFSGKSVITLPAGSRLHDVLPHIHFDEKIAATESIFLKRLSVAANQKKALEDALYHLEKSAVLALSSSGSEANIRAKEAELTQAFVARAKSLDPPGVVVTATQSGMQKNIILEDGDTIIVPRRTDVVQVDGEVFTPAAIIYQPKMSVIDYVQNAGGYSYRADKDKAIIIHQNGQVSNDLYAHITPGDKIVILPRVDSKDLQAVMDLTTVIYQIGVAASAILRR